MKRLKECVESYLDHSLADNLRGEAITKILGPDHKGHAKGLVFRATVSHKVVHG